MTSRSVYPLILGMVCLVSGLTLGATYSVVKERIAEQEQRVLETALKAALADAEEFETVGYVAMDREGKYHAVSDGTEFDRDRVEKGYVALAEVRRGVKGGETVGYVLEGSARGYSSEIRVAVGGDVAMSKVVAIKVISQQETPGLGARVNEVGTSETLWSVLMRRRSDREGPSVPWFQANFAGASTDTLMAASTLKGTDVNGDGKPDAITGATITSNAVLRAVQSAIRQATAFSSGGGIDGQSSASAKWPPAGGSAAQPGAAEGGTSESGGV